MRVMKRFIYLLFLTPCIFQIAYSQDFPVLEGPYLGQKPPGMTPEIFASGIISTGHYEQGNSFSPDGKAFYYTLVGPRFGITLFMQMQHGRWSKPQTAPFSGKYNDYYPYYSPDGKRLYFVSLADSESVQLYWRRRQGTGHG